MPKEWHDLHDKLKKENPNMPDSEAWAIATNIYKKKHDDRTPQQDAEKEASEGFKEELLKKKEELLKKKEELLKKKEELLKKKEEYSNE